MARDTRQLARQKLHTDELLGKFSALLSLLAFFVILVGGIRAGVEVTTIVWRASIIFVIIGVLKRVLLRVIATYEEMNRG